MVVMGKKASHFVTGSLRHMKKVDSSQSFRQNQKSERGHFVTQK